MDIHKLPEWSAEAQKKETKAINEWFAEKSKTGMIGRVLDDNDLTADVQMLLIGGAIFKAAWKGKLFSEVSPDEFKNFDGKTSTIDFLKGENVALRVDRDETDKTLLVEVPFTEHDDGHGHKHGMKVVLMQSTSDDVTLDKLLEDLTKEKLTKKIDTLTVAPLRKVGKFSLPKMRFDKEYELKESLGELGVKAIFDSSAANFSLMLDSADISKKGEIVMSQIEHKAIVQWTQDADDSAKDVADASAPEEAMISMNKPFAFFILDVPKADAKKTKRHAGHDHSHGHEHDESAHLDPLILFAGRINAFSQDLQI